jgi:cytochrome P450
MTTTERAGEIAMTTHESVALADLPALADLVDPADWSTDIIAASRRLFSRNVGLLRAADGAVMVVRNEDLRALAENPHVGNAPVEYLTGRSEARARRAGGDDGCPVDVKSLAHFLRNQVFTMNPPVHAILRRGLARPLMPRAVQAFEPLATRVAREVLAEAAAEDAINFGPDFAAPYVTRFWTRQLGIPVDHAVRIQHLMEEMNLQFLFDPSAEESRRARRATAEYMALLESQVEAAWSAGPNELLAQLAAGVDGAELDGSPADFRSSVASNFFDAFHTIGVALTNATFALFTSEDGVRQVRDEPALIANAFSEGVRLAPPLMLLTRMALDDFEYQGVRVPKDTPIHMIWGAGNHDPAVFESPDTFDLRRGPRFMTTFGGGAHICPGRNAARMLAECALRVLTSPEVRVEFVDQSHEWVRGSGIRQLESFRVKISIEPAR